MAKESKHALEEHTELVPDQESSGSHAHISLLQQTFADGFHTAFIVLVCIAAVGVFTSLMRGKEER